MALPIWTRSSFPTVSLSHQEASISLSSLFIRGWTKWKPQSQKTNQTYHMDHSLVLFSETMSHAVWGHPKWTGHGGEVWQNVVHWRREWQTTSVFLPSEPHNSMKKQNDRILKEELPRSVGAQYATGDQWRNNSRKNEETVKAKATPSCGCDWWWK